MKYHADEYEKILNRPHSKAPDLLDDEPFSLERTLKIYENLQNKYEDISPTLIKEIFEINSRLAWSDYRKRYDSYILDLCQKIPDDKYICYLSAVVYYDHKEYRNALKYIDFALTQYTSSADMTHFKSLCLMQIGELELARTYMYQALFLAEISPESPPKRKEYNEFYPNFPVEFHTSADLIRADLNKLDQAEHIFEHRILGFLDIN
ncbi:MAG: hypothetical protein EH224_03100 [Calditrichaeota bacterium]|nr:MAG: hypothetical protein EH224_03100 [Calditrichota bacterium]